MYDFEDKKGRKLTMRPEGTLPVARAILENKLINKDTITKNSEKFFYIERMFRYERPQKFRLREFKQLGVEIIGGNVFNSDIESI